MVLSDELAHVALAHRTNAQFAFTIRRCSPMTSCCSASADGATLVRMGELASGAPVLDDLKLEQIAALPLGSRIKLDRGRILSD
jgi:hypothetical protein